MSDDLLRAFALMIADIAVFLEFSDDSTVNPDDAVRQLEMLAYRLRQLSPEDQASVASAIRSVRGEYGGQADFVDELPDALGLLVELS